MGCTSQGIRQEAKHPGANCSIRVNLSARHDVFFAFATPFDGGQTNCSTKVESERELS